MVLLGFPLPVVLVWLFLLGAALGSFLNVCIYRIPQHEKLRDQLSGLWSPPSRCPGCKHRIPVFDNIPIIGWLKLRGRCRFCRGRISIRYPLIELGNGLLFAVVYWFEVPAGFSATVQQSSLFTPFGPQVIDGWSNVAMLHWRYAYHMVLLESLVVATFIDFDLKIIPDAATLPAMAVGVLGGWMIGQVYLVPVWFQDPYLLRPLQDQFPEWLRPLTSGPPVPGWVAVSPHLHGLIASLAGLIVGGGTIWAVRLIGDWVLRQEAMGFGDVVLMATIGSFLGWQPALVVFFIAPVCALLVVAVAWIVSRQRVIPYGPYLSLATLLLILGWKQIWPVAQRVFELGLLVPVAALIMAVMLLACLQLIQAAKRLLGIPLYPDQWIEEWTSADQLAHFSDENVDSSLNCRRTGQWRGSAAGRGRIYEQLWRCDCPDSWQRHWQRRDSSSETSRG